jgi:hypothetical protein
MHSWVTLLGNLTLGCMYSKQGGLGSQTWWPKAQVTITK